MTTGDKHARVAELIDGIEAVMKRIGFWSSGYLMAVSAPGRYRVKVPDIDNYDAVPPFEGDIPRREIVTRNVALQRRR